VRRLLAFISTESGFIPLRATIRGNKVMLDRDLSDLYEVETKQLKRSVRRNLSRFPEDFMFELTKEELEKWRYQFGTSNKEMMGLRVPPFAFTEHGVIMLASVLNNERAILVNIQVVRIFIKMREMLASHKEILHKLEKIEHKLADHDNQILVIFEYLKQLEQGRHKELEPKNRNPLGYKRKDEQ
jgi:phage regulator Rha-like protein